jgi:hypothetical protein
MSSIMMQKYFVDEMASIVDEEKRIKHQTLAGRVENVPFDDKSRRRLDFPADVSPFFLSDCFSFFSFRKFNQYLSSSLFLLFVSFPDFFVLAFTFCAFWTFFHKIVLSQFELEKFACNRMVFCF